MNKLNSHRRRRGASMIEALVALVVLSFSALGYAALQIKGLSANTGALTRSKATQLAEEMADRIRSNSAALTLYSTANYVTPSAAPSCSGGDPGCSSADMATVDVAQWTQALATELPGGTGVVCIDSQPQKLQSGTSAAAPGCDGIGTVPAVKVFWLEHGAPMATPVYVAVRP